MAVLEAGPQTQNVVDPLEALREQPHFRIPGFEKLSLDRQQFYLQIPGDQLHLAEPIITNEIEKTVEADDHNQKGAERKGSGKIETDEGTNQARMADQAIETWHRASSGDSKAAEDLMDAKRELLGKEPDDAEIWEVVFQTHSSNLGAEDHETGEWMDIYQQLRTQEVADLFNEFRGSAKTADEVIKPELQMELFDKITEIRDIFHDKLLYMRKVLETITGNSTKGLQLAIRDWHLTGNGTVLEDNVKVLNQHLAQTKSEGYTVKNTVEISRPIENMRNQNVTRMTPIES